MSPDLPPPDPAETAPRRRKPGPRPRVSRQQIARAALQIGLDAATIKALAAHLGMDHSSLYRHVRSRDEIVEAAADLAIEGLDWNPEDPTGWREMLERLTAALWTLYERHPGLANAFRDLEVVPETGLRAFARAVERLEELGLASDDAAVAVETLVDALTDCFIGWQRIHRRGGDGQSMADRAAPRWQAMAEAEPAHQQPIAEMVGIMQGDGWLWWLRRQRLIFAGIASLLTPSD